MTIAYSAVGDGPLTLVLVSPVISQLELAWEEPALEHFWSRFAACTRVLMFDRRDAGRNPLWGGAKPPMNDKISWRRSA